MDIISLLEVNCYYLLLALALFSPFLVLILGRRKIADGKQLPPGPYAWPIIGNMLDLDARKPHVSLANLAETFGPLFSLRFGSRIVVVASSPAAAREVFKTHDRELSGRFVPHGATMAPEIDSSVVTLSRECNERWRFLRSISHTVMFSSRALESHSKLRAEKVKQMFDFLTSKDGDVVKIGDVIFATIANTLTNIMVSQDVIPCWSKTEEIKRYTRRLIALATPGLVDLYPGFVGLDFWNKPTSTAYVEISRTLWGDTLNKRREKQDAHARVDDLLEVLIQNSLTDNQIYNILTELFVSSESLTTGIEWAMSELTRNQEALAKLRDELVEAIEGTVVSERELSKLPYLQACIKETMRLHPPSPFLVPRSAVQTCQVMDYKIPKNSVVVVNAYAMGRDPRTWEDSLSFKPERFLGNNHDLKGNNYELVPFGGGRRICVGYPLAHKQIQLLLASLVLAFDWSLPPGMDPAQLDMSENFGITLQKENPLLIIPRKKKDINIV